MNKWKTLVLSLLICCLAVAASGTLAYYTATEQAHNVITSGGIDIALQEYADAGDALVPFEDVDGVMPGMEVSKIVCVENTGASVPENMRREIFQPGFSTKGEGRGMGLHIVSRILGEYGGAIELSTTAEMTCFHGSIPRKLPADMG